MDRYFCVKVPRRKGAEERVKSACRLGAGLDHRASTFAAFSFWDLEPRRSVWTGPAPGPRPQAPGRGLPALWAAAWPSTALSSLSTLRAAYCHCSARALPVTLSPDLKHEDPWDLPGAALECTPYFRELVQQALRRVGVPASRPLSVVSFTRWVGTQRPRGAWAPYFTVSGRNASSALPQRPSQRPRESRTCW